MYEIKPILDKKAMIVELPTIMYKIKTIDENFAALTSNVGKHVDEQRNGVAKNDNSMETLEKRQHVIIEQLKELKTKLLAMQKNLNVPKASVKPDANPAKNSNVQPKPINLKYIEEVVLNVNPKNIPYSLIALQTIWQNRLNLQVNCHTHSSIPNLPEPNQYFSRQLNKRTSNPNLPTLNVTLIWKDVPTTELICIPTSFIPISGEINALRYFIRIGPNEFGYSDGSVQQTLETEQLLDTCHRLIQTKNGKERQALLRQIGTTVQKQKNLNKISDIALSSAMKQLRISDKDITPDLSRWLKTANTTYGY